MPSLLTLTVRGYTGASASDVAFVWDAVVGATSYVLQVGRATGVYDVYNANVGDVLTTTLTLTPRTYYARTVPVGAGSATAEQVVTV